MTVLDAAVSAFSPQSRESGHIIPSPPTHCRYQTPFSDVWLPGYPARLRAEQEPLDSCSEQLSIVQQDPSTVKEGRQVEQSHPLYLRRICTC